MKTLLFCSLFLAACAAGADQLPFAIKQISFYYERDTDGKTQQQVFVVQEEKIGPHKYYVVMMHIGDEGLPPRPEDPRLIKVLPDSLVTDLRRWLDTIVTQPEPSYNGYSFAALCGPHGPPFGMTLRQWSVGRQMPYGPQSSILCSGASAGFFRLRENIENIYWHSDRSLLTLQSERLQERKLEAFLREKFGRY